MLDNKGTKKEFGFLYCKEASKWILHPHCSTWNLDDDFILNYCDSVNKKDKYGNGKYCMNDILKIIKE